MSGEHGDGHGANSGAWPDDGSCNAAVRVENLLRARGVVEAPCEQSGARSDSICCFCERPRHAIIGRSAQGTLELLFVTAVNPPTEGVSGPAPGSP